MFSQLSLMLDGLRDNVFGRRGKSRRRWQKRRVCRAWDPCHHWRTLEPLEDRLLLTVDPLGGEFRLNCYTSGDQANVSVDADATGNYVAVWQGPNAQGWGTNDIYLQRYNPEGTPLGLQQPVNPDWHGEQTYPDVAVAADGKFVVTWTTDDGDGKRVCARLFAAAGTPLTGELSVNTYTTGDQEDSEVAVDADGNFVVVWQSDGQDGSSWGVYGQRFDSTGTPQGGEIPINTHVDGDQSNPVVAADGAGNFVVAWQSYGQDGSQRGVYAQRYAADGTTRDGEVPVNTYTSNQQRNPAVAMDAAGNYVVAWNSSYQDGSGRGVYGQRYDSSGVAQAEEFRVNTYTDSNQADPAVAFDSDGSFLVVWNSYGQDGSSDGVYGQRYDVDGAPIGGEFRVNTYTSSSQGLPDVAFGAGGDFLVAWRSTYQDGSLGGSYGQLYGEGLAQADLVPLTATAPGGANLGRTIDLSAEIRNQGGADAGSFTCRYYLSADPVITTDDAPLGSLFTVDALPAYQTHADGRQVQVPPDAPTGDWYVGLLVDVENAVSEVDEDNNGTATVGFPLVNVQASPERIGGEFRINTSTSGDQQWVSVDADAAGNYVAVWEGANRQGWGTSEIYFQRLNAEATPLGLEKQVNPDWHGEQTDPDVAVADDGSFVVVWTADDDGDGSGVRARCFAADGTPLTGAIDVNTLTAGNQSDSEIAMNAATGEFVVVWASEGQDGSGWGVYGQRFNPAGVPQGGEFPVNTHTDNDQQNPTVVMDAAGNFIVAWDSRYQDGSDWGIYAQRYAADGAAQGGEFQVNTYSASAQFNPAATMAAGGAFVVAWNSSSQDGSSWGVYAQRYDSSGVAQGEEFLVNTCTESNQADPAVAFDSDGSFLVVWNSYGQDGSYDGVYGQRYDVDGTPFGGEFRVNTYTTDYQSAADLCYGEGGDLFVAWQSRYQDGSGWGSYGQLYGEGLSAADLVPLKVTAPGGANLGQTIDLSAEIRNQGGADAASFTCRYYLSADPVITTDDAPLGGLFTVEGLGAGACHTDSRQLQVPLDALTGDLYVGVLVDVNDQVAEADETNNGTATAGFSSMDIRQPPSPLGGEFRMNTSTNGDQNTLSADADASGNYVVVWQSQHIEYGSDYDVFLQRYNAEGSPLGLEVQVNPDWQGDQTNADVAVADDGTFVVTWSTSDDGDGWGVQAQRFAADGSPVGDVFLVNTETAGDQSDSEVAIDKDTGEFVIVWHSDGQDGSNWGVYGQRFGADGTPQGSEFQVNAYTENSQQTPAVAMDMAGNFLVAWESYGQDGSGWGVYAKRYAADGTALGDEFRVNTYISNDQRGAPPALAMDASGNFVVAWHSYGQDASWDVYAQRYLADGTALGDEFRINTYISSDQGWPAVAMDASGNFVVAWQSYGQDGSRYGVYAQQVAADGTALGGEWRVNTSTSGDQYYPAVAVGAGGDFLVAFSHYNYDVYGQFCGEGLAQADLVPVKVTAPTGANLDQTIDVSAQIRNQGSADAGSFACQYYLSADADVTSADTPLGDPFTVDGLAAYTTHTDSRTFVMPDVAPGDWYVGIIVDTADAVTEADDANNAYQPSFDEPTVNVAALPMFGPEFPVNTATADDQQNASIAMASDGRFVVVWESENQDGDDFGVYGQRFDAAGAPVGPELPVNTTTAEDQQSPSVAMAPDGRCVVVWQSESQDGSGWGVYGQRFAADGSPVGDEFPVNTYTQSDQDAPSVAMDADGKYVVVWHSVGQDVGNNGGIYGQRYLADGSPDGVEFWVCSDAAPNQQRPVVAMDGAGRFVVSWDDGSTVYARRFLAEGIAADDEFVVNTYGNSSQDYADVDMDAAGNFVIAWRSYGQDGSYSGVYAQRYAADGVPLGGEFPVNQYTSSDQLGPSVSMDAAGNFVIAWHSYGQDENSWGIFARRYAADGTPVGGESRVNLHTSGEQSWPDVAVLDPDHFLIAWQSDQQDGSGFGIYAQQFGQSNVNNHANLTPTQVSTPRDQHLGETVDVTATVVNTGLVVAGPSTARLYLSDDDAFDPGVDLDTGRTAAVSQILCDSWNNTQPITFNYTWPDEDPIGTDCDYYFFVRVDADEAVTETDEADNAQASGLVELRMPDLEGWVSVAPSSIQPGDTLDVEVNVRNFGDAQARPTTAHLWLSDDSVIGNADDIDTFFDVPVPQLSTYYWPDYGYYTYQETKQYTWPITDPPYDTDGQYYFYAKFDVDDDAVELDETDNEALSNPFGVSRPNLVVHSVVAPSEVEPGEVVTVSLEVRNIGTALADPSTLHLSLSGDPIGGNGDEHDLVIDILVPALPVYAWPDYQSFATDVQITWPVVDPFGTDLRYHVAAEADAAHEVDEGNEDDNWGVSGVVRLRMPDLEAVRLRTPSTVQAGQELAAYLAIRNAGLEAVPATTARIRLSDDDLIGGADDRDLVPPCELVIPGLAGDQTWSDTVTIPWPEEDPFGTDGEYHLIVELDYADEVSEGNESNNALISDSLALVVPIELDIELVGHLGGASRAAAVSGDYAYELTTAGLRVLDVSDPAAVTKVNEVVFLAADALGLHLAGNRLHALTAQALRVFDVSTPHQPELLAEHPVNLHLAGPYTPAPAAFRDDLMLVIDNTDLQLKLYDLSDPASLVELSAYALRTEATGLAVEGDTAYVLYGEDPTFGVSVLEIVDVSDPSSPAFLSRRTTDGLYASSIVVDGDLLAVGQETDYWYEVKLLDVANPAMPRILGDVLLLDCPLALALSGNTLQLLCEQWSDQNVLTVVDVSDPTDPAGIAALTLGPKEQAWTVPGSLTTSDTLSYVAWGSFAVVDLADRFNPVLVDAYSEPSQLEGIGLAGTTACVISGGLMDLIDVSEPAVPRHVASYTASGYIDKVVTSGAYAVLVGGIHSYEGGWVEVVDLSDPAHPAHVATHFLQDLPYPYVLDVAVEGDLFYLLAGGDYNSPAAGAVFVMDVSDPANPVEQSAIDLFVYVDEEYDPDAGQYVYVGPQLAVEAGTLFVSNTHALDPEPNDARTEATGLGDLSSPVVVQGAVGGPNDGSYDWYRFSGTEGDLVTIDLRGQAEGGRTFYDGEITLYNSSGAYLTSDYYYAYDPAYNGIIDNYLLEATGDYYIRVYSYYSYYSYTYELAVALNQPVPAAEPYMGLSAYDVSDPANPELLSTANVGRVVRGMEVAGSHVYVSLADPGMLEVWDFSDPAQPAAQGSAQVDQAGAIIVNGNLASIGSRDGMQVVDVVDPVRPVALEWYPTGWPIAGLTAQGAITMLAADSFFALAVQPAGVDTADLAVTGVALPPALQLGTALDVDFTVRNHGRAAATGIWLDAAYLSTDAVLDPADDFRLGELSHTGPLDSLDSYDARITATVSGVAPGEYYVIVCSDETDAVDEWFVEANNVRVSAQPIYIGHPDLAVTHIDVPPVVDRGDPLRAEWIVYNRDDAPAGGSWTDAVYLSDDDAFDAGDPLLATVPHDGGLDPRSVYHATCDVDTGGIPDGTYYLIVKADSGSEVFEDDRETNNTRVSGSFRVGVPELTLGVPLAGTFEHDDQSKYYAVTVPAGEHLFVSLDDVNDIGHNELFIKHGSAPTRSDYDACHSTNLAPDQAVEIGNTLAGTYYILVYAESAADAPEDSDFTISASALDFEILGVSPIQAGNAGELTMTVRGAGFPSDASVVLVSPSGTQLAPTKIHDLQEQRIIATFDLTGAETGAYDVRVDATGVGDLVEDILQVSAGVGADLTCSLVVPGSVRVGRQATLWVHYSNTGDADMPAPLFMVSTDSGGLRLEGHDEYTDSLQVLGVNFNAPAGILWPGASGAIPIYFLSETMGTANFDMDILIADDSPVDWDLVEEALRPDYMPDDAWAAVWANFVEQVGPTWADYLAMLDDNASYLSLLGNTIYEIPPLLGFELHQADGLSSVSYLASATDVTVQTPGLSLDFFRAFAQPISSRYQVGALGRGWAHSWEQSLTVGSDGTVRLSDISGIPRLFLPDGSGGYVAQPGDAAILIRTGQGRFQLTEADGLVSLFRADGLLDCVQDAGGNRITAGYSGGLLTSLTHSCGGALQIEYNAAGRIERITDPYGRETVFSYDAANEHLLSVTRPGGRTTWYTYSIGEGLQKEHALRSVEGSCGCGEYFTYDTHGRLVETDRGGGAEAVTYGYDTAGTVTVEDAAGRQTTLFLGLAGRVAQIRNAQGNLTRLSYDRDYRHTVWTDPAGSQYRYTFDSRGNVNTVEDPLGNITSYAYHPSSNQLASVIDARGNRVRYGCDEFGNLASITYEDGTSETFTYDASGNRLSWTNRRGDTIAYTYNSAGQLTSKDYADTPGLIDFQYVYDTRGNLISTTDPTGTTAMQYDPNTDWLARIDYPGSRFFTFEYDDAGRRTKRTDHDGNVVNYMYDAVGRVDRVTDGTDALIVDYDYDASGLLTRKTLGNAVYTTYEYDTARRLTHLVNCQPSGTVISRFDYTYDAAGRRTSMTTLEGTYTYAYDPLGQLTSVTHPDGRVVNYVYDAVGNRIEVLDDGASTAYTTNEMNQYTDMDGVTYTYDHDGNLLSKTEGGVTTTYTYDIENRLIGVATPTETWTYSYDAFGNRVASAHNGVTTSYVVDPMSTLSSGAANCMVDPLGLTSVAGEYDHEGNLIARYDYGSGLVSRTDAVGNSAYYTFSAIGNTSELTDASGQVVNDYSYDPFGISLDSSETLPNPFEFVGEYGVMDEPNGLQFMRARSYDPLTGRFIQEDPIGIQGGVNFYKYALNNPVSNIDPRGFSAYEKCLDVCSILLSVPTGIVGCAIACAKVCKANPWCTGICFVLCEVGVHFLKKWGCEAACTKLFAPKEPDPDGPDGPGEDGDDGSTGVVGAYEPNDKSGPAGAGDGHYVLPGALMPYTVFYENDPEKATAPAMLVEVEDYLDTSLDWSTFELGDINLYGDFWHDVPEGLQHYETLIDLRLEGGVRIGRDVVPQVGKDLLVDVLADFDSDTGLAYWRFQSLDPDTLEEPDDPFAGFLSHLDENDANDGSVSYLVRARDDLTTGTVIANFAVSTFDQISSDTTPTVFNTIDAGLPTSSVEGLPTEVAGETFTVSWSGQDDADGTPGSGIATYTIYVKTDDGDWEVWLEAATETSAEFVGMPGHRYAFRSVAEDYVGHVEDDPGDEQAATEVPFSQFRVLWLEPTPSGFVAGFNRALDESVLSLYDVEAGVYGPADVTVVREPDEPGDPSEQVAGSLLYDGASKTVTFVQTGGPLKVGTYTVTLRSAADAFQDVEGNLLDGDADDVEGGDYVTTVTVEPSTARVVSLPDFARGPGQPVDVPATTADLPIRIDDGTGVNAVDLTLRYDPQLLVITGAQVGPDAPAGSGIAMNLNTPGVAILTFYTATPLSSGEAEIVSLVAEVPCSAVYGAAHLLDLTDVEVNEGRLLAVGDDAVHVAAFFGDTTGNRSYSGLDAAMAARVSVELDFGFEAFATIDPVVIADVTGNGTLSGQDACLIAKMAVDLDPPEIPPLPTCATGSQSASGGSTDSAGGVIDTPDSSAVEIVAESGSEGLPAGQLTSGGAVVATESTTATSVDIPDDLAGTPGQTVTAPVNVADAEGIESVDLRLLHDASLLDATAVLAGSAWPEGNTTVIVNIDEATGRILATVYNPMGPLGAGAGSLFDVDFQIASGANAGDTAVIDLQSIDLNEGAIPVDPDPQIGPDPTDGLITVSFPSQLDMRLVLTPTVFAEGTGEAGKGDPATGEVDVLPEDEVWIHEWNTFWVEIWVRSGAGDVGVESATVDLVYDTELFTATAIEHGPAFVGDGTIVDPTGLVDDLDATTSRTDVGDDGYALLARVQFEPTADDEGCPHDLEGSYVTPVDDPGLGFADVQVNLAGGGAAAVMLDQPPESNVWPVIYDVDDDGCVSFGDLAFFAEAFTDYVDDPDAPVFARAGDFDRSGHVYFNDLAFFAENFGCCRPDNELVFPSNFPDGWTTGSEEPVGLPEFAAARIVQAGGADMGVDSYSVPRLADWNADGRLDLVVGEKTASGDGKVRVYLNTGTAAEPAFDAFFYARSGGADLSVPAAGCLGVFPEVVDWNQDGRKDLVLGLADGRVEVLPNENTDADPRFGSPSYVQVGPPGSKTDVQVGSRATVDVVDWNNDGRHDLVLGALDGAVRVLLDEAASGPADFRTELIVEDASGGLAVPSGRSSVVVTDLDGDGHKDLLSGNTNGELLFYANTGSDDAPAFDGYELIEAAGAAIDLPGTPRSRPWVGDYNHDGTPDLLVGAADGLVRLYLGQAEAGATSGLLATAADTTPDGSTARVTESRQAPDAQVVSVAMTSSEGLISIAAPDIAAAERVVGANDQPDRQRLNTTPLARCLAACDWPVGTLSEEGPEPMRCRATDELLTLFHPRVDDQTDGPVALIGATRSTAEYALYEEDRITDAALASGTPRSSTEGAFTWPEEPESDEFWDERPLDVDVLDDLLTSFEEL